MDDSRRGELAVTLTRDELLHAMAGGAQRQLDALLRKRGSHFEHVDSWENHICGAMAEMAVARYFDRYWFPCYDDPLAVVADVGRRGQVRCIKRRDGGLWFRAKDDPQQAFVLVHEAIPVFTLLRWAWGHEAMNPDYLRPAEGEKPEAWCMPQTAMKHIPVKSDARTTAPSIYDPRSEWA